MEQRTRNHSAAGVALLLGAAAIAFAATQPWATGTGALWGRLAGVTVNGSLGFDLLVAPGGRLGDVKPLLLGCGAVLAVLAVLLFLTRVPGLGILWRILALGTLVVVGLTAMAAWTVVSNPSSVVADPDSTVGRGIDMGAAVAEAFGVAAIEPGVGLWLLTAGCAIAAIGVLIPAARGRVVEPVPAREALMSPGWYPDQLDGRYLRFFDGVQWTGATRPRG